MPTTTLTRATKTTSQPSPTPPVDLAAAHPEYGALLRQRHDLEAQAARAQVREQELRTLLTEQGGTPRLSKIEIEARKLLGQAAGTGPSREELTEQLQQALMEQEVIHKALSLLAPDLDRARGAASRAVCSQVKPRWEALLARLAEQVAAAVWTHGELEQLYGSVEDAGGTVCEPLTRFTPAGLPTPQQVHHPLSEFLREQAQAGRLDDDHPAVQAQRRVLGTAQPAGLHPEQVAPSPSTRIL